MKSENNVEKEMPYQKSRFLISLVFKRVFHWLWWPVKVTGLANVKIGRRRLVTRVSALTSNIRTGILPNPVKIGSHKFFYGPGSRSSIYDYLDDRYELETTEMVDKLLQAGDVFVDVGANIGYFTLRAASRVGDTGKVHAFEPFPETYQALAKSVLANEYGERTNVSCIALSDAPGEQKFFLANRGSPSQLSLPAPPRQGLKNPRSRSLIPRLWWAT